MIAAHLIISNTPEDTRMMMKGSILMTDLMMTDHMMTGLTMKMSAGLKVMAGTEV